MNSTTDQKTKLAFPRASYRIDSHYNDRGSYVEGFDVAREDGMTLRDYFAAKAMQSGLLMNLSVLCSQAEAAGHTPTQQLAGISYAIADAMLAERAKGRA